MANLEEPPDRPSTPPRRSIYDLEKQVNEIFDGLEAKDLIITNDDDYATTNTTKNSTSSTSRACRAKALPDLFRKFSEKSGKHFLDPNEMDLVVQFAHANEDVIVTSDILMNFLSKFLQRDGADQYESPPQRRERQEKQVYKSSPSSTDDLELSNEQLDASAASFITPKISGDFPSSENYSASQTVFHTPYSSNNNQFDDIAADNDHGAPPSPVSPLAVRKRTSPLERQPPQPQRPASIRNSKHRRQSEEHYWNHHHDTPLDSSFENSSVSSPSSRLSNISADQFSTPTIASATPISSKAAMRARMRHAAVSQDDWVSSTSPPSSSQDSSNILSPKVDATSYYPTPEELSLDIEDKTDSDTGPIPLFKSDSDESLRLIARASSEFLGESFGEALASSGGLSFNIESLASRTALSEQETTLLIRSAQELGKRLKEQERLNVVAAESSEATIADLQVRIEDIQNELAMKRKDEKELRQKEKQYLTQINALEQEVNQVSRSLDKQKDLYTGLRKQYEEQCQESEKLRDTVRFKEQEAMIADEAAQTHAQEYVKWERERSFLEGSISRLEREISVMRVAEEALEEQQQQNMELKETIDRLRFDLDGLRTHNKTLENAKSMSGGASGTSSLPGSMSRNLGREIAQQLNDIRKSEELEARSDDEASEEEIEEGVSHDDSLDKYIEQVFVTRTRRIKIKDGSFSKEQIFQQIDTADAGVQCDLDSVLTNTASIQTTLDVDVGTDVSYPSPMPELKERAECGVGTANGEEEEEEDEHEMEEDAEVSTESVNPEELVAQRQLELAKSLGLDLEAIRKYVKSLAEEKQQHVTEREAGASAKPIEPPPPYSTIRPSTWTSAVPEAASTIINIIHPNHTNNNGTSLNNGNGVVNPPQSVLQYYLQSPAATVALCSIVAYLTGVLSVSMYTSRHYHYFATPLGMGASDRALWNAYNNAALEGLGFSNGATHGGGGLRESAVFWLKRVIWTGVNVALRVPT